MTLLGFLWQWHDRITWHSLYLFDRMTIVPWRRNRRPTDGDNRPRNRKSSNWWWTRWPEFSIVWTCFQKEEKWNNVLIDSSSRRKDSRQQTWKRRRESWHWQWNQRGRSKWVKHRERCKLVAVSVQVQEVDAVPASTNPNPNRPNRFPTTSRSCCCHHP